MTDPKRITLRVTDTTGQAMSFVLAPDMTYEEWKPIFKTILTFLEYGIPDEEKEHYEREDF